MKICALCNQTRKYLTWYSALRSLPNGTKEPIHFHKFCADEILIRHVEDMEFRDKVNTEKERTILESAERVQWLLANPLSNYNEMLQYFQKHPYTSTGRIENDHYQTVTPENTERMNRLSTTPEDSATLKTPIQSCVDYFGSMERFK